MWPLENFLMIFNSFSKLICSNLFTMKNSNYLIHKKKKKEALENKRMMRSLHKFLTRFIFTQTFIIY
ncbi:hypothetical protein EUGRSUZ_B00482 [Eucalyptus grandis]|uniref:Uncharacterized protein n=2 Tax=Eucalyptus grandis TaxID=71139 RepID=A0A059CZJ8_EUCGR|nr:hypothetical protein EUGRSUZ_B00482 [Eucalyptus grandis]